VILMKKYTYLYMFLGGKVLCNSAVAQAPAATSGAVSRASNLPTLYISGIFATRHRLPHLHINGRLSACSTTPQHLPRSSVSVSAWFLELLGRRDVDEKRTRAGTDETLPLVIYFRRARSLRKSPSSVVVRTSEIPHIQTDDP
jgi:hypothetical protein